MSQNSTPGITAFGSKWIFKMLEFEKILSPIKTAFELPKSEFFFWLSRRCRHSTRRQCFLAHPSGSPFGCCNPVITQRRALNSAADQTRQHMLFSNFHILEALKTGICLIGIHVIFLALEICAHQSRRRACETYKDGLLENERATHLVTGRNRVIFGAWARNFRKFLTFLHLVRQPSPHPSILRGEITLKACAFDRRTAKIQIF